MSERAPVMLLPLWAVSAETIAASPTTGMTPTEHGRAGADDAVQGMGGGISEATKRDILAGIASFHGQPFTTDTLRGKLSQASRDILNHPHHHNAMQGMIQRLAKSGAIRFTGQRVVSVRPEARGREIKIWEAT